jgi:hypothetical protein
VHDPEQIPLTRRAALRLTIWGAVGLSLLPGCRPRRIARDPKPTCYEVAAPPPQRPSVLERWAELGRVWRQMGMHYRARGEGAGVGAKAFAELREEMRAALDGVDAGDDLRLAFTARWSHISDTVYPQATCYKMAQPNPRYDSLEDVEKRFRELDDLLAAQKLSQAAVAKAARALASDVEVLRRSEEALKDRTAYHEAMVQLDAERTAGKLQPSPSAAWVGKRLAEMTVDRVGMLTEPPAQDAKE